MSQKTTRIHVLESCMQIHSGENFMLQYITNDSLYA